MGSRNGFGVNIIDDRGKKSGFVAHRAYEFVEQGRDGGFSIRTGDPDEGEGFGGFAIPSGGEETQGTVGVLYENKGSRTLRYRTRQVATGREIVLIGKDYGCSAVGDAGIDEGMSIDGGAYLGDEEVACADLTAIEMDAVNLDVRATDDLDRFNRV